jgi:ferredoxin
MPDLHERLQRKLDEMATGYPSTESGVELRVLKQLFDDRDAELFLAMSTEPETSTEVALRLRLDPEAAAGQLEDMAKRGLLFRLKADGVPRYFAVPFIVGIYEFQVNFLSDELLKDISEYYITALGQTFHSLKTPHLRSIPVNAEIAAGRPIAPYDDAASIIKSKDRIAVAECLCRKAVRKYGKGCGHPLETCMQFDSFAEYYVDNAMARYISLDEALAIHRRNEEEGLVIQTMNSQNVEAMCACCSCCCGMLISLKLFPAPAREWKSNYICLAEESVCTHCGSCVKRCPVAAVRLKEDKISYRPERCIGCGLCVTTCPSGARKLSRKPDDRIYTPPETFFETFKHMCGERE